MGVLRTETVVHGDHRESVCVCDTLQPGIIHAASVAKDEAAAVHMQVDASNRRCDIIRFGRCEDGELHTRAVGGAIAYDDIPTAGAVLVRGALPPRRPEARASSRS